MPRVINHKTWVEIDHGALLQNLKILQDRIGGRVLLAMVKANAYGHGLMEIGKICDKAKVGFFGVDSIDEAIELRRNGVKTPILIIAFTPKHRLEAVLEYNLSQIVYDLDSLNTMAKIAKKQGRKFKVHVKFDTGMSRQGIKLADAETYIRLLQKQKEYITLEGLLTHFADADNLRDQSYSDKQLTEFAKVIDVFNREGMRPKYVHGFNTAATLAFIGKNQVPQEVNMCRTGIGIYGLSPSPDFEAMFKKLNVRPVLTWKARIIQTKTIKKGAAIGYGITEVADKDLKIAILPVGYYEGVPRSYSSVGQVLIDGRRCRILGRVSMNLTVVDITSLKTTPRVWDEVVLIGRQGKEAITADEFAERNGTINYEIVTRINPLIPRVGV